MLLGNLDHMTITIKLTLAQPIKSLDTKYANEGGEIARTMPNSTATREAKRLHKIARNSTIAQRITLSDDSK